MGRATPCDAGAVRVPRRALVLGAIAAPLAGCAERGTEARAGAVSWPGGAGTLPLYVIAGGWHTELGLPAAAISGPLATLARAHPGAETLVFGWGQRDYDMAPHPGLGALLGAVAPGPAVLLVIPLPGRPIAAPDHPTAHRLAMTPAGSAALCAWLWESFATVDGRPRPLGSGPCGGCTFYAATGTYDLAHTCNSWTAEGLRAAGLPVSPAGVITAGQVLGQLPPVPTGGVANAYESR